MWTELIVMYQEDDQPDWEFMGVKLETAEAPVPTMVNIEYIMGFNPQDDEQFSTIRTVTGNMKVKHTYEELKKMIAK